jgi:recombinase
MRARAEADIDLRAPKRRYRRPRGSERAKALTPVFAELAGKPDREIARELNERALIDSNIRTPTGAPWSAVTVKRVRDRLAAGV